MTKESARRTGATRTLLGRYRKLPGIAGTNGAVRGHMERAAINTPIQVDRYTYICSHVVFNMYVCI